MYSIKENIENIIEIKKSKFITKLYKVNSINEVNEILNKENKEYNDNIIYKFYLSKEQLNFIPELEKIAIHVSIKDKVLIEND